MGSAAVRLSANCCWLTPSSATAAIESNLPGSAMIDCAVGRSNRATVAPAGLSAVPKRAMPEMVNSWGASWVRTWTVSPTAKPSLSAVALSITTWLAPHRAIAGREHERVQLLDLGPAEAERGRALARIADGVAFGVDVLGEALDLAIGVGHAVGGQDVGQQALVDATPDVTPEPVVEGGLGPDDGIGALVDVGEQVVEDPGDGVGEDQGADDEGHAEHHGDGRGQHASLAGQDPLQRDLEHAISPRGP